MSDRRDLERLLQQIMVAHPQYDSHDALAYLCGFLYDQLPHKQRQFARKTIYDIAVKSGNPVIK